MFYEISNEVTQFLMNYSVLIFLVGVFIGILGYKYIHVALFIQGFIIGGSVASIVLSDYDFAYNFILIFVGALIGGVIGMMILRFAAFCNGVLFGFVMFALIGTLWESEETAVGVGSIGGVVGGILGIVLYKPVIMLATSFIGAVLVAGVINPAWFDGTSIYFGGIYFFIIPVLTIVFFILQGYLDNDSEKIDVENKNVEGESDE